MNSMKKCPYKIIFILIIAYVFSLTANAKTFTSQFTEFELPNGWECVLEGSEWVCQSDNADRKKEAIIIMAAKYRGEQDSLDQYQAHLKSPKTFNLPGGKTQISEAKSISVREINGHRWIDALHLASEVPGFYTRYLATVKDSLGIAVTFSVAKDHYDSYQDMFEKVIATLKVFNQKGNDGTWTPKKSEDNLLNDGTYIPDSSQNPDIAINKQKKGEGDDGTTLIMVILAAAAIVFVLMKRKKKKDKKK